MCIYIDIASNTRKKNSCIFQGNCFGKLLRPRTQQGDLANFRTRISRLGDQRLIRLATASPFTSTKVKNSLVLTRTCPPVLIESAKILL